MGGLSVADALLLRELLAKTDVARYERAALCRLQRFIDERLPPLTEVALAASALAELRHGRRSVGVEALNDPSAVLRTPLPSPRTLHRSPNRTHWVEGAGSRLTAAGRVCGEASGKGLGP
jgi:hypothetical protein